ncbi:M15 family metallopeptidase [Azorhizobium caulinodans]|uniref:M15 family metallopeptidase n=1 Tax=Azorhizobium caulinodans TaxID=7 RepID=UPI002FBD5940
MAETLKDYLLTLGFKVEKGEEARFKDAMSGAAKTAAAIAASMTAAAAAISATVLKIASDFDALYFAAQRSNATVASIKSLSYALSQVGGSSGQAAAAIEGVATALRTNPGTEGFLKSLGVATRENGRLRETGAIIHDIVEVLKTKPYYVSAQIARVLGIDEKTWNITVSNWGKIEEFQEEYRRQAKAMGVDPDKAAESSNKLMTSFRQLQTTVSLTLDKIITDLQPVLSRYLAEFGQWVQDHSEEIKAAILAIVQAVAGLAKDLAELAKRLNPVVDQFIGMTEALVGPNGLKAALEAVMIFMAGVWLARMLGVLSTLMRNPAFIALAAIAGISYDLFGMTDQEKLDVGGNVNDAINGKAGEEGWFARQRNRIRGALGLGPQDNKGNPMPDKSKAEGVNPELQKRYQAMLDAMPPELRDKVRVGSGYRSEEQQKRLWDEAVRKYGSEAEARKWVAPPGKSQHNRGEAFDLQFDTPEARAWVHQNAEKYGLTFPLPHEPWHMERTDGRQKRSSFDADGAMRQQSALMGQAGNEYALMPGTSRSVSISQQTQVNIQGSKDPAGTADAVTSTQPRVNADLLMLGKSAFA